MQLISPIRPIRIPDEILSVTDILIVNETELGFLACEKTSIKDISAAAQKIKTHADQILIITLGSKGALVVENDAYLVEGLKVKAIDTVGAGDCFTGVIAAQLAQNKSLREAVEIANKAASICVTRKGAAPSMPHAREIQRNIPD